MIRHFVSFRHLNPAGTYRATHQQQINIEREKKRASIEVCCASDSEAARHRPQHNAIL